MNFATLRDPLIYIKEFEEYLKIKGYAETTIKSSIISIKDFLKFTAKNNIKDIIVEDIKEFCRYKKLNKVCSSTIEKNIGYLRSFFRWLAKEGLILINPMDKIEMPRAEYKLPLNILSEKQILKLINSPDTNTLKGKRDRAIIETMYSTGIRVSELCNLKIQDLDLVNGYLRVNQGKGLKDRIVPLGKKASEAIKKYLIEIKEPKEYVFWAQKDYRSIKYITIINLIKGYGAGLNIKASPHTLRRTFATHMIKRGANVMSVKAMLGHKKIAAIERYVKLAIKDLKEEHAKCHGR